MQLNMLRFPFLDETICVHDVSQRDVCKNCWGEGVREKTNVVRPSGRRDDE